MKDQLTKQEALKRLFQYWPPERKTEKIPIGQAIHRVPAVEYHAQYNIPLVRASAMDGIAVRSADFQDGWPDTTRWQLGVDYVRADTGDDFDDRFDTVIRIEDVTILPKGGVVLSDHVQVKKGMAVRPSGSFLACGALLNHCHLMLRPDDLAAIAMGGFSEIEVIKKPRVAFLPTGSELVSPGEPLPRGCNYDTNSLMACHMLEEMGAEPIIYPITPDNPALLKERLYQALDESDLVIINGGSSKGGEDYGTRLLASEGELLFHGVAAGPGRPMAIAIIRGKPVINIAGPSLGCFYSMEWCIRPAICRYLGIPVPEKVRIRGKLTADFHGPDRIAFLCRMEVTATPGGYLITPFERGKADLAEILMSNAMYISPPGDSFHPAGDEIEVEMLRSTSEIPYMPEL